MNTWANVLSLMTLAELSQRRVGHAISYLRPTTEAIGEWQANPSPDTPLWALRIL
jgi:hypothetical protein